METPTGPSWPSARRSARARRSGAAARVGARALIYLRRKPAVRAGAFRAFINDELVPALAGSGALTELVAGDAKVNHAVGVRTGMFGVSGTGDTSGYGGLVAPVVLPGDAQRPYGGWFDQVADALEERLAATELEQALERVVIHRGEITLHIRRQDLAFVAQMLRDDQRLRFELLSGVSGVHYPDDAGRELHAVYHLLSMTHNRRVRLEVTCPDADPHQNFKTSRNQRRVIDDHARTHR